MMNGMAKTVVGPVHAASGTHVLHGGAGDFRTLRWYFVDFVLPVLALAAMSALTAVMLVLVVSAVADMELSVQDYQTSPDLWRTACFGPAFTWDSQSHRADLAGMDMLGAEEPWLDPQANGRLSAALVGDIVE
jgi:hypothetical protein